VRYLLFTECLQNDFVAPMNAGAPLPNELREAGLAGSVSARQYWIAQLRYSAHTLTVVESDERQKRFALASTCRLADRLARSFSG